jgi:hypothetical protein
LCAGLNRRGAANERVVRSRASDPRRHTEFRFDDRAELSVAELVTDLNAGSSRVRRLPFRFLHLVAEEVVLRIDDAFAILIYGVAQVPGLFDVEYLRVIVELIQDLRLRPRREWRCAGPHPDVVAAVMVDGMSCRGRRWKWIRARRSGTREALRGRYQEKTWLDNVQDDRAKLVVDLDVLRPRGAAPRRTRPRQPHAVGGEMGQGVVDAFPILIGRVTEGDRPRDVEPAAAELILKRNAPGVERRVASHGTVR